MRIILSSIILITLIGCNTDRSYLDKNAASIKKKIFHIDTVIKNATAVSSKKIQVYKDKKGFSKQSFNKRSDQDLSQQAFTAYRAAMKKYLPKSTY